MALAEQAARVLWLRLGTADRSAVMRGEQPAPCGVRNVVASAHAAFVAVLPPTSAPPDHATYSQVAQACLPHVAAAVPALACAADPVRVNMTSPT